MSIDQLIEFYEKEISNIYFMKRWLGCFYFYLMPACIISVGLGSLAISYYYKGDVSPLVFIPMFLIIVSTVYLRNRRLERLGFIKSNERFLIAVKSHQITKLKDKLISIKKNEDEKIKDLIKILEENKQKRMKFLIGWVSFSLAALYTVLEAFLDKLNSYINTFKELLDTYVLIIFFISFFAWFAYFIKDIIEDVLFSHDELISLLEDYRLFHLK